MFVDVVFIGAAAVVVRCRSQLLLSGYMITGTVSGCVWYRCWSCAWTCWSASWRFMFSLLSVLLYVILGQCNYIYDSGIMYMLGTHGGDAGCFVAGVLVGMGGVVWVCPWLFFCSCLV